VVSTQSTTRYNGKIFFFFFFFFVFNPDHENKHIPKVNWLGIHTAKRVEKVN
jgi:hypothetical protein